MKASMIFFINGVFGQVIGLFIFYLILFYNYGVINALIASSMFLIVGYLNMIIGFLIEVIIELKQIKQGLKK